MTGNGDADCDIRIAAHIFYNPGLTAYRIAKNLKIPKNKCYRTVERMKDQTILEEVDGKIFLRNFYYNEAFWLETIGSLKDIMEIMNKMDPECDLPKNLIQIVLLLTRNSE